MTDTKMARRQGLTLSWTPVRDRHGRVRMEAQWIPASSPAQRRPAA